MMPRSQAQSLSWQRTLVSRSLLKALRTKSKCCSCGGMVVTRFKATTFASLYTRASLLTNCGAYPSTSRPPYQEVDPQVELHLKVLQSKSTKIYRSFCSTPGRSRKKRRSQGRENGLKMCNNSSSKPGDPNLQNHLKLCIALVAFLMLGQIAATVLVPRSLPLTLINDVIEFILILLALLVFLANASASTRQTRLFWMLLAACWGVRIVGQAMWMYFDLVLRKEAPNPFVGDILLFLSNIPVLAALLLQPHLNPVEGRKSRGAVDFLLLLLWWLYLYLFFVIPWQYVVLDEARYGSNYDRLHGLLDVVLLLTLGFLWSRSFGRWKWFYASFFGAQLFITASGYLANQAIDEHLYYPGSWYDLPYAATLASFTMVGLLGLTLARAAAASKKSRAPLHVARLGMLAVLSLPVIGAWTVLNRNTT